MITAIFLVFGTLASAMQSTAQEAATPAPVAQLLEGMKSSKWADRSKAFEQARCELTAGKLSSTDNERLKLGIINLLITENKLANVPDDEAVQWSDKISKGQIETEGEEFYPSLVGFVADMHDERAIPALVGAMPYASDATGALLRFGDRAVGAVIDQLKSRNALLRVSALEMAVTMEGQTESVSASRIRQMLRAALADPASVVRLGAVNEISCLDDRKDFLPLLEKLAESDPEHDPGTDGNAVDGDQSYPVRFTARRALREIQNNEPCLWRY